MEPRPIEPKTESGLQAVVHEVAAALQREGNVHAVFGEPVTLDTRTVIPVATIALGGGAGGTGRIGAAVDLVRRWLRKDTHVVPSRRFSGGGGIGIDIRPAGFLSEENGRVVFTRIDDGRGAAHAQRPSR